MTEGYQTKQHQFKFNNVAKQKAVEDFPRPQERRETGGSRPKLGSLKGRVASPEAGVEGGIRSTSTLRFGGAEGWERGPFVLKMMIQHHKRNP